MKLTMQQVEKLFSGQYKFKQISFSMLVTRLKNSYISMPTEDNLKISTHELNAFIDRYSAIMGVDISVIDQI